MALKKTIQAIEAAQAESHPHIEAIPFRIYYLKFENDLSHILRMNYKAIKYIDDQKFLSYDEKYEYIAILRSIYPSSLLSMLFYNSLTSDGENLKKYIDKYALLDNLSKKWLLDEKHRELLTDRSFSSELARSKHKEISLTERTIKSLRKIKRCANSNRKSVEKCCNK